jgi:hypothetical protein
MRQPGGVKENLNLKANLDLSKKTLGWYVNGLREELITPYVESNEELHLANWYVLFLYFISNPSKIVLRNN